MITLLLVAALGGEAITAGNFARLEVVAELGATTELTASTLTPYVAALVEDELVVWRTDDWREHCRLHVAPRVEPVWVGRHLVVVDAFRGWVTRYDVDACRARSAALVAEPGELDDEITIGAPAPIDRRTLWIWVRTREQVLRWDVVRQRPRKGSPSDFTERWRWGVPVDDGGLISTYVGGRFGVALYDRGGVVSWAVPVSSTTWAFDTVAMSPDRRFVAAGRSSVHLATVHDAPIALWRTDGAAIAQPAARAAFVWALAFAAGGDVLLGTLTDKVWEPEPQPDAPAPRTWVQAWRTSDGTSLGELPGANGVVGMLPGGRQLVTWGASTQVWALPDEVSR